ncbi:MAG: DNA-directed DNA polymerase II small subunit [Methanomicrobiales archaeon]|jgi:DNA polymerase II small subunit|nr:DNA-directed DNA polymerase II small subunit [Methanomicrobiales archaeon]
MLDTKTIVQRFLDIKLQVHPEVVQYLTARDDPTLIDQILLSVPDDTVVVSVQHIPGLKTERDGVRFLPDPFIEVVQGAEGSTMGVGGVESFSHHFRDRYNRLGGMIRTRAHAMPIEALIKSSRFRGEPVTLIGMVIEIKNTSNGHRLVHLEDPTGTIPVLFNKGRDVFSDASQVIYDEVIGVRGTQSPKGEIFFGDQIYRPDVPISHAPYAGTARGSAVLISDIHVGSETFLEETWERFAAWIGSSRVSYLLVAGDLVDGIGIYPGQEKELSIKDVYEQYNTLARMMTRLPSDMRIILAPGNHDVVRGAEPQPAVPSEFLGKFPGNCTFVENPAMVSLQGVRFLLYHGRSIDDAIGLIPGASYENPAPLMEGMLQRRHLAPAYGRKTPIAPDHKDRLIIDPIPEVFHTGHVHIQGLTTYRGVLCVNAGTWQAQTAFQRQMNVNPTPGRAVVVDLETLNPRTLDFL